MLSKVKEFKEYFSIIPFDLEEPSFEIEMGPTFVDLTTEHILDICPDIHPFHEILAKQDVAEQERKYDQELTAESLNISGNPS